ncbi:glycoside hydrolase family 3 C-terminal domain-containing protein, partial [Candidatus Sumerlaeota bacterium]|nr:glycoside hydrolase family 3 C-terminal domain-containing protein [Candidatus Sumerlaeota bacterium]
RQSLSANVPERMLHEYWLPHFKACVVEGRVQSLMASYNAINGTPNCVNKLLLTDILRGRWGFDGFVVSDLGGIGSYMRGHMKDSGVRVEQAVADALAAGCDYDDEHYRDAIPRAVEAGLVSEEVVNRALSRVLRVAFRLGVFDPPEMAPYSKITASVIDSPEHRRLSLTAEREAIVLLSNKDGFLPLDRDKIESVAVIGPLAARTEYGNYFGARPRCVSVFEGIKNKLGANAQVTSSAGCGVTEAADPAEIEKAVEAAKRANVAVLFLGANGRVEAEGRDRVSLGLPGAQEELLKAVVKANPKTVVVLMNAGPLSVAWAKENVPAILEAWYPGEEGGAAIADVLFGDCNPGGRLPYTVYDSMDQIPPMTEYDITKGFTYMYFKGKPQFAFGHGLSYTQFAYGKLDISPKQIALNGKANVSVEIANVGKRVGDEVVQLYIHDTESSVKRPLKELRGFERIHLKPGEKKKVTFALAADALAFYDEKSRHDFVVEPGMYDVLVGSSSVDIRATGRLEIK